jgi:6-phosphogluconolactonase
MDIWRWTGPEELPRFDVLLLGVGADGHTASLFPGSPTVEETRRLVVATPEHNGLRRVTFTLPLINAARNVLFLVSGREKSTALARAIGPCEIEVPASLVSPWGELEWLVDKAAAANLASVR